MTAENQPCILEPPPPRALFVTLALNGGDPVPSLYRLAEAPLDPAVTVGVGAPLVRAAGGRVPGLRAFPSDLGLFPSTQGALWLCLEHPDDGARFDAGHGLFRILRSAFSVTEEVQGFRYRGGRDLSGFEDGTENPKGDALRAAALVTDAGPGMDAGSFVAVQRWQHDLAAIEAMTAGARDALIGRHLTTNEEIAEAPPSAHVKRTAQESFEPPAFIARRSLPWGGVEEHGLYFVAYGESLDRFERQLRRMAGRDDGIVDGLMAVSRALSGGYYFCPPLRAGKLDLRALGL